MTGRGLALQVEDEVAVVPHVVLFRVLREARRFSALRERTALKAAHEAEVVHEVLPALHVVAQRTESVNDDAEYDVEEHDLNDDEEEEIEDKILEEVLRVVDVHGCARQHHVVD